MNRYSLSRLLPYLLPLLLTGCLSGPAVDPGIGKPVDWTDLPGWQSDRVSEAWPALVSNCLVVRKREHWKPICEAAKALNDPQEQSVRGFLQTWFQPHRLNGKNRKHSGLITGYYEPLLQGSRKPDDRYRFPLYQQPEELLIVDLKDLYPELAKKRIRARLDGNRVVPFYSRAEIDSDHKPLAGNEILWVDNRDDVFFLQIQGSGLVQLPDGEIIRAGYANQNGHPYFAIGKDLIEREELTRDNVSLFTIRQWLRDHPDQATALLNKNPSYVFFTLSKAGQEGPKGSLAVPLTAQRSIAIDPSVVTLGTPVWLDTTHPADDSVYQRLVFAQDTGGAIKGPVRADLFWGRGNEAEQNAGEMKQSGRLYVLLPKPPNAK